MPAQFLMDTYGEPPVTFVSGNGTILVDNEGSEYLDFLCGLAVTSLGHARPEVSAAIAKQAGELLHVSNLFDTENRHAVAAQIDNLIATATGRHGKVFFGNSGAEANECAIKLARKASNGRFLVLSATESFHGRTLATLAATGQHEKHVPFLPMPAGFESVAFGDLSALERTLANGDVAGVLIEAIQAEGGINVPPKGYLPAVEHACRAAGALFMVDEIQSGLGRTGEWFAFQDEGLTPDVVTMAKALGNGMPVGACWAASDAARHFGPGDHGSTFGGQPLAMAAANATLATMVALDAPQLAGDASKILRSAVAKIPGVVALRGRGLLLGVELDQPIAKEVVAKALKNGLVLNALKPSVIRMTPPLTVATDEIDQAVAILALAVRAVRVSEDGT